VNVVITKTSKMKKLPFSLLALLCALTIIAVNGFTKKQNALSTNSSAAFGNTIVSGGGTTEEFGALTTYEFNAVQQGNGKATGHILLKFRAAGGSLWVQVDCLRLFDKNKATLSGVITKVMASPHANPDFPPPPFIYVGGRVSFTVQDNGEGGAATPDLVSDIGVVNMNVTASCTDEMDTYLPLSGNVQINRN
jgi:hypothetical protein